MRRNAIRISIRILSSCERKYGGAHRIWVKTTQYLSSIWDQGKYV